MTEPVFWPRPAASIAVFRKSGPAANLELLLAKRSHPPMPDIWSLPGGKIEPGETAADTALRELAEETGVRARLLGVIDINDVIIRDGDGALKAHYVIAAHAGLWIDREPVAASDAADARFVPIDQIETYALTPRAAEIIAAALVRFPQIEA